MILAIGLILSLTAGEFDLSFAGVMSVSLVLVGWLNVEHHWAIGFAVMAAIVAAFLIGCMNAFFVLVVGVESIVVTLGTGTLLVGVGIGINNLTIGGISQHLVDPVRAQVLRHSHGLLLRPLTDRIVWYVYRFTRWAATSTSSGQIARSLG